MLDSLWFFDAFFWMIAPVAILEGVRTARLSTVLNHRRLRLGITLGLFDGVTLLACAACASLLGFVVLGALRIVVLSRFGGELWTRGLVKLALVGAAFGLLHGAGGVPYFSELHASAQSLRPDIRMAAYAFLSLACVAALLPVRACDEAKQTLVAPFVLIAFARGALPLSAVDATLAAAAPIVAVLIGAVCALWLLSAGMRANHFEHSTLVSEILMCERGVLLSFMWLGLASGERLAGVGAMMQWWSAALALLALEASLRVKVLPKAMAFFALAMAVGLPGTTGFIAEDLLAHGLLELRPALAAAFVMVAAVNAVALYRSLVNLIVDLGGDGREEPRLSPMMVLPAGLSLLMGLVPHPFVATAFEARVALVPTEHPDREVASTTHAKAQAPHE